METLKICFSKGFCDIKEQLHGVKGPVLQYTGFLAKKIIKAER